MIKNYDRNDKNAFFLKYKYFELVFTASVTNEHLTKIWTKIDNKSTLFQAKIKCLISLILIGPPFVPFVPIWRF